MKEETDRQRSGRTRRPFDPRRQQSYLVSNQEVTVPLQVTDPLLDQVRGLKTALGVEDAGGIGRFSQRVVDGLCDAVGIQRIPVRVGGQRLVRGRLEFYGFCGMNGYMTLYSRTARRDLTVAFKTYFNTLVHEYMHHYDWHGLRIQSMHTAGFYRRVRDVYARMLAGLDLPLTRSRT